MNKEQAVTYLKFSGFSDEQIKAIEGAFSCPSAGVDCEDCPAYEDAIGRKAVLKIYDEWFANCNIADKKESPKSKIKALPPVTPQPKMGHWIDEGYEKVDHITEEPYFVESYVCSVCNYSYPKVYNYCPNCGAKMVEPQESREV